MKCWKCGKDNLDDTELCRYCGSELRRSAAAGEVGKALRSIYDRYGCRTVLTNSSYLVSGLGDLVEDSKKLRNQLKMAMDAGMGRAYLEQLELGWPDADFLRRIRVLLTEDAGLNEKTAGELIGYFDEMIGWQRSAGGTQRASGPDAGRQQNNTGAGQREANRPTAAYGNRGSTPQKTPRPRPTTKAQPMAAAQNDDLSREQLSKMQIPLAAKERSLLIKGMIAAILFTAVFVLMGVWFLSIIPIAGFICCVAALKDIPRGQEKLHLTRDGGSVLCEWEARAGEKTYLAINDGWYPHSVAPPFCLNNVPAGATITLARVKTVNKKTLMERVGYGVI